MQIWKRLIYRKYKCHGCGKPVKYFHGSKMRIYWKIGDSKPKKQKAYWQLCDDCAVVMNEYVKQAHKETVERIKKEIENE